MLLRKHEWHEVDFTESTFAEYAVVSHSIVLLVIAAEIGNELVSRREYERHTQSA